MKNKKTKVLAQMKSSHYYIFWGIATATVVIGQIYVGTSYRTMADSLDILTHSLSRALRD